MFYICCLYPKCIHSFYSLNRRQRSQLKRCKTYSLLMFYLLLRTSDVLLLLAGIALLEKIFHIKGNRTHSPLTSPHASTRPTPLSHTAALTMMKKLSYISSITSGCTTYWPAARTSFIISYPEPKIIMIHQISNI